MPPTNPATAAPPAALAPSQPAAPAPQPGAAPLPPPPAPRGDFKKSFEALEGFSKEERPEPPSPFAGTPKATPKPEATEPEKEEETSTEIVEAAPTPARPSIGDDLDVLRSKSAPPKPHTNGTPPGPKQLREAYEARTKELEASATKIRELEAAVARAADEGRTAAESKAQSRLEAALRERDELENEMKYVRYESTREFKEKYRKPLTDAYQAAQEDIEGLAVLTEDGTPGRKATLDDVLSLANMRPADARRAAAKLFGEDAPIVMDHRNRILEKHAAAKRAQEEWKENGSKYEAEQAEKRSAAQKEFHGTIDATVKELAESAPEYFGEPKDDPEALDFVSKGKALVDLALGRTKFKEGITPQQQAKEIARAQGMVMARSTHYGRLALVNQRQAKELTELKAELAKYKKSEPSPGEPKAERKEVKDTWMDRLGAIAVDR